MIVLISLLSLTIIVISYHQYLIPSPFSTSSNSRHLMNQDVMPCRDLEDQIDRIHTLMHSKEKMSSETISNLKAQVQEGRKKIEIQYGTIQDLERRNRQLIEKMTGLEYGSRRREDDYRLAPQIKPDTIRVLNIHQKSEFEVIPFTAFTASRLYQLESGMINKPEAAPMGNLKAELENVTMKALEVLNRDNPGQLYENKDLIQGYHRVDRMIGTQYELFYRSTTTSNAFEHVQIFRPFAPLQRVQHQTYEKRNEWINLVVPLSGRVETFHQFMEMFVEQCIKRDGHVFLTIVYFGEESKEDILQILTDTAKNHNFESYKFIEKSESFSRGIGLLAGAEAWIDGNVLLFFCDVDVVFKPGFLDRCRLNSAPGTKVYYPIVFSLYNPSIVYADSDGIPSWKNQLVLKRDTGFWRTFGFGMTCMYRSDFLFMRGFDTKIQGWGMEDVKLYRKIAQSNFNVIRAPDPGIFHTWHEKTCDPHLPLAQYNMCLGSKALGEASHVQLGMLAFSDLKRENELLHEEKKEDQFENLAINEDEDPNEDDFREGDFLNY